MRYLYLIPLRVLACICLPVFVVVGLILALPAFIIDFILDPIEPYDFVLMDAVCWPWRTTWYWLLDQ